jgi:hypothetical protein
LTAEPFSDDTPSSAPTIELLTLPSHDGDIGKKGKGVGGVGIKGSNKRSAKDKGHSKKESALLGRVVVDFLKNTEGKIRKADQLWQREGLRDVRWCDVGNLPLSYMSLTPSTHPTMCLSCGNDYYRFDWLPR